MADPFVLTHVRRLPLFARLTPQQFDWVADVTQILRYGPGEVVYRQGDPLPGLYMFISGSGELTQRSADRVERPFGKVATNEFINETAIFSPTPSPMTLTIAETSIVLFVGYQAMQAALAYHPDIKASLNPTTPPPAQAAPSPQTKPPANIRSNETVVLQIHRHWWMIAGRVAWIIIAGIALWIACLSFQSAIPTFPWVLIALVGTLALAVYAVYVYLEWQNDLFVVTDRRVINTHQTIITFRKEVNEIPLDAIHEIGVALPPLMDFVGRILGYGTLIIKTSGDANNMVLSQVSDPKSIQQIIFQQRKNYQEGLTQEEQNAARNAIKAEVNKFLGSDGTPGSAPSGVSNLTIKTPHLFSLKYTNEKGETVYRKHHVVWTQHELIPGMMIVGGIIVLLIGSIGFFAPLLLIVAGAVLGYLADWDWRNDLYIVGDQTITIIHKRPLFLQDQRDQVLLAQVDNVVAEVSGLLDTLLQIGNVRLMLVGVEEKNAKVFKQVYQPQQIQQEISRRQDYAEQAKREGEAQRQRQAIVEYLSVYHETVQNNQQEAPPAPASAAPSVYNMPSAAPSSPPPSTIPEDPPRVRDRSRPPGIPRARRDDSSSRPG